MRKTTVVASSRRRFIKQTAVLGGGIVAAPYVIPSTALGGEGRPAAGERIVIGHIGMGWFGTHDLKAFLSTPEAQNVAVCDVEVAARNAAKALADKHYGNRDCKTYHDFRELLDRDDIDAVSIATPDHWHAIPTIQAASRGKDVHVEKPLSLTIGEGRAMVEAIRQYGRVCQVGSEARSNPRCRFGCELVRNGRIGEVKEVYVGGVGGPSSPRILPAEPVPEGFDWNMWLGPAPWRPYNKAYHPRSWRGYYDFSGGGLTDWGAHHFDLAQWALGMDDTGPAEICPPNGKEHKWLTFKYANGIRMYHVLGANFKDVPVMLDHVTLVGSRGRVGMCYSGLTKTDPPELIHNKIGPDELHLYECPPGGHMRGDFLRSIRTRKKPGADIEIGHRTVSVCHLAHIAYQLGRPLKWDPVTERFIDDEEANRMCSRSMRGPWRL
jgi:predicted dehydrogenase